jgi:recombinational DNA repair protein (RecF pathway)
MKNLILIFIVGFLLISCKSYSNLEIISDVKIQSYDTLNENNARNLMLEKDFEVMSKWTDEEKAYFYEHFVFSIEELKNEVGITIKN